MSHSSKIGLCYLFMLIFLIGAFSWAAIRSVPVPWEYWNNFCIFFLQANVYASIGFATIATCLGVGGDSEYTM